jgi:hypothetical protein
MKPTLRSLLIVLVVMGSVVFLFGPTRVLAQVVGMFTEVQSLPGDVAGTKVPFRTSSPGRIVGALFETSGECPLSLDLINPAGEYTIETITVEVRMPVDEVPSAALVVGVPGDRPSQSGFHLALTWQGEFRDGDQRLNYFAGTHPIRVHVHQAKGENAHVLLRRRGDVRDGFAAINCDAAGYVTAGQAQEPPPNPNPNQ